MSADFHEEKSEFLAEGTPRNALVIFCRAPRLGQVKTRLAATQGDEFALGLYRAMLHDTFELGHSLAPEVETWAYHTPEMTFANDGTKCIGFAPEIARYWRGHRWPQGEGDLGTKMLDILKTLRSHRYHNIVLIGSDSPDLPREHIQTAFEHLQTTDLVIGPSEDGGFYLLGVSRDFKPAIFEGIEWSTNSVYSRLMQNLRQAAPTWTSTQLPTWRDVDEEDDLVALRYRLFIEGTHAPQTRIFLGGQEMTVL